MSQSMNPLLLGYYQRLVSFPRKLLQLYKGPHRVSTSELLLQVREATTAHQLTKVVNKVQSKLYSMSIAERRIPTGQLIDALTSHVLYSSSATLRMAAAQWLRLLTQAGAVSNPWSVFVTLVTATTHSLYTTTIIDTNEQQAYLEMIFDCFWPFRFPYPAFSWQQFPSNEVFYPLAPLLDNAPPNMQELLIAIFSELPLLNDPEIADHLLPIALAWSTHTNAEHRCQAANVLARMQGSSSQEALHRLASDVDPAVRNSAKHAMNYVCDAQ